MHHEVHDVNFIAGDSIVDTFSFIPEQVLKSSFGRIWNSQIRTAVIKRLYFWITMYLKVLITFDRMIFSAHVLSFIG